MTKKERVLKFLACVLCFWCVAFSLIFPKSASEAAFEALRLCALKVVPSLFLFIVSSKIFLSLGGERIFVFLFGKAFGRAFGVSENACASVFLGLLCGYPAGAVFIGDALAKGKIERREAESILPFVTAASPAFLLGTVGSELFGDIAYGILLLMSQTASSLILLFFTRKIRLGRGFLPERDGARENMFLHLSHSISDAGITVVSICSFITFFSVFSETVLRFIPCPDALNALVNGFFEVSCGFAAIAKSAESLFLKYFAGGAILGFSGVSVLMQSGNLVCECGVSMKKYAAGKARQALLCGGICFILGLIYEKSASDMAFSLFGVGAPKIFTLTEFALISVLTALCVLFFCRLLLKILHFFSKK